MDALQLKGENLGIGAYTEFPDPQSTTVDSRIAML